MELNESYAAPLTNPSIQMNTWIALEKDYAICRQIIRSASRRYSFASNFLPPDRLRHVEALYAFLRIGDDRVDLTHAGFDSPEEAIDDWEMTYRRAFETGDSPHPVMREYLNTALKCDIPDVLHGRRCNLGWAGDELHSWRPPALHDPSRRLSLTPMPSGSQCN